MIKYVFMFILLALTIAIIVENNNYKIIVLFSGFSLVAACLYFFNNAPDVALAEIAVGSAFIPLIFLIAMSKQRTFTVMEKTNRKFEHMEILTEFCRNENLKLIMVKSKDIVEDEAKGISGVFRHRDIDLIIDYNKKKKYYIITGKEESMLIDRLQVATKNVIGIRIIKRVDTETID